MTAVAAYAPRGDAALLALSASAEAMATRAEEA
jgi:hypothetical protein